MSPVGDMDIILELNDIPGVAIHLYINNMESSAIQILVMFLFQIGASDMNLESPDRPEIAIQFYMNNRN